MLSTCSTRQLAQEIILPPKITTNGPKISRIILGSRSTVAKAGTASRVIRKISFDQWACLLHSDDGVLVRFTDRVHRNQALPMPRIHDVGLVSLARREEKNCISSPRQCSCNCGSGSPWWCKHIFLSVVHGTYLLTTIGRCAFKIDEVINIR